MLSFAGGAATPTAGLAVRALAERFPEAAVAAERDEPIAALFLGRMVGVGAPLLEVGRADFLAVEKVRFSIIVTNGTRILDRLQAV